MDCEQIAGALERNGIPFHTELPEKLEIYLRLLQEWNQRMDLTAAGEDDELLDRHFIDSLAILCTELLRPDASIIDVGTGAGFPGMVLALALPESKVTLMDAQQKRLNFLEAVAEKTGTGNVCLLHDRAETGGRDQKLREQFDYACARAVAPLNVLCEYLLPFVRVGGCALCWKGPALEKELMAGRRAAHLLGGRLEMPVSCTVEGREWEHIILPVRKTEKTASAYPRKAGMPKSKPLGELKTDGKA
jgi:16S rRNA (guanine527-N7)-methyltransferase